jgi:hypothetical protein
MRDSLENAWHDLVNFLAFDLLAELLLAGALAVTACVIILLLACGALLYRTRLLSFPVLLFLGFYAAL